MPRVDAYASRLHYAEHLAPIWGALPERGGFFVPGKLAREVRTLGLDAVPGRPRGDALTLVAGGSDSRALRPWPVALVEHGAGQAYDVDDIGYSGGGGRENVVLFLCPNEVVASRNRIAYPGAAVAVVGSPRVEALRTAPLTRNIPSVALSFHFDSPIRDRCAEAGSALSHYEEALSAVVADLRSGGLEVLGHGHPRGAARFRRLWRALGVEWITSFAEVVGRSGAYACDNSSTLYEAAACGVPVVVMNAPWYRRGVDLWPRFWRLADVGVQVDGPEYLPAAVRFALTDPPSVAERRQECVSEVYGPLDGGAALRAAHAVAEAAAVLQ